MISRGFQEVPLFDLLSRQDGLDLPSLEEESEESILRVEDAMHPTMGRALLGDESIASARTIAGSTQEAVLPGIAGRRALERAESRDAARSGKR